MTSTPQSQINITREMVPFHLNQRRPSVAPFVRPIFTSEQKKCTMPCNRVKRVGNSDTYTVCDVATCTFAHNLAELRVLPCSFGTRCRNPKCRYSHDGLFGETGSAIQIYQRAGIPLPELPMTAVVYVKPDDDIKVFLDNQELEQLPVVLKPVIRTENLVVSDDMDINELMLAITTARTSCDELVLTFYRKTE